IIATVAIDATAALGPMTIDQNAGLIAGAIKLSPFADTLNIRGGAINGNIIGSGVSDTVNFTLGAGNTFTYGSAFGMSGIAQANINSGTVILDGHNIAINTAINGGTLVIGDAAHPAALLNSSGVNVNAGGILAGNGTITLSTGLHVNAGGTLAPGTPGGLGTLTATSGLFINPGSFYAVNIAPGAGNNSRLIFNGFANLNGNGTVVVTPQLGH